MGLDDKKENKPLVEMMEDEFPEHLRAEVEKIRKDEKINAKNVFTFQNGALL